MNEAASAPVRSRADNALRRTRTELMLRPNDAIAVFEELLADQQRILGNDHPSTLTTRHNLAYWHNKNWLGVGPSAASHIDGKRWRNAPNLPQYLAGSPTPPTQDHEQLDAQGQFAEQLMLGLRLKEGIDADWFDNHPARRKDQRDTANEWVELSLLQRTDGRLRLTRKGLFVADSVIAKLL